MTTAAKVTHVSDVTVRCNFCKCKVGVDDVLRFYCRQRLPAWACSEDCRRGFIRRQLAQRCAEERLGRGVCSLPTPRPSKDDYTRADALLAGEQRRLG